MAAIGIFFFWCAANALQAMLKVGFILLNTYVFNKIQKLYHTYLPISASQDLS